MTRDEQWLQGVIEDAHKAEPTTRQIIERAEVTLQAAQYRHGLITAHTEPDGSMWVSLASWEQIYQQNQRLIKRCAMLANERDVANRRANVALAKLTEISQQRSWWQRAWDSVCWLYLGIEPKHALIGAGLAFVVATVAGLAWWRAL